MAACSVVGKRRTRCSGAELPVSSCVSRLLVLALAVLGQPTGAQVVATPSLGNGTSPPGRTVPMLCNTNGRKSFVINIYGTYDSRIVNSLGVTCSDGNFFDAGDPFGDYTFSVTDTRGFISARSLAGSADPVRLGFRNSTNVWYNGPPGKPIGAPSGLNNLAYDTALCKNPGQVIAGFTVVSGKPVSVPQFLNAITRIDVVCINTTGLSPVVPLSPPPPPDLGPPDLPPPPPPPPPPPRPQPSAAAQPSALTTPEASGAITAAATPAAAQPTRAACTPA
ncbi:hypothetical protein HXX76_011458 [Chlamydomonas incerta]|uniref:Uncharacterized protein n=1 Tax=Chlamydomonas incerta TaxID=51695 RepID=A0A835VXJ8_CHLIN|nr:hypothetical protein HXX76_011458 [Chlamydomonas incerta]|eukprot:KAG2428756.1 hypothetical protein HXX76_011458 [Chlamydomonas incerta]